MSKKIKVLMVLNRYYPIIGGAENQCRILMNSLKAFSQIKLFGVVTHKYSTNLSNNDVVDEVPIFRIGPTKLTAINSCLFYMGLFYFMLKKRHLFDVVHVHTISFSTFVASVFSKIFGKVCVAKLTVVNEIKNLTSKRGIKGFVYKQMISFLLKNCTFIALTDEGAEEIKYFYSKAKIFKINNGVDPKTFFKLNKNNARKRYGFHDDFIYFGFVGRLIESKGILKLIEYFIEFCELNPELRYKLVVMGSGDFQVNSVEKKVKYYSKEYECIEYLPVEHSPTYFYNSIDFYISNSLKEGMPNTVLEALACGKIAILSSIRAHLEIAVYNNKSNIFIFNSKIKLFEILKNIDTINLKDIKINENFFIEAVAKKYVCLYEKFFCN